MSCIGIASDHGGFKYKELIKTFLDKQQSGWSGKIVDFGCQDSASVDYPLFAKKLCQAVQLHHCELGILICGTGIGMSMVANRYTGIRAALCHNVFTAQMSKAHNNANVLCLGARVLEVAMVEKIVTSWLTTKFEGGRHQNRLNLLENLNIQGQFLELNQ